MSGFDSGHFRKVLGHFPTSVTVVTAAPDGVPVGLTIGSFTSVSLEPPLVGWLPGKGSTSWPDIRRAGVFCVNMLAADQGELCWTFAKDIDDKFDDLVWTTGRTGSPIIEGAVAWIDCTIEHVIEVGDHFFVVGAVLDLHVAREDVGPLLFYKGKLGDFALL